jgi:hypothetical protein
MKKPKVRGIAGLLDGILSTVECTTADSSEGGSSIANLLDRTDAAGCPNVPRRAARRGRPSGKAVAAVPREKVTVRIAAELIATYRDWSWEARAQLSHLVEQALTEYRARHGFPPTEQFSQAANRLIQRTAGH